METGGQKSKRGSKSEAGGSEPGAPGQKQKFQLPPGYSAAYLGSGKSFSSDEVDFAQLRESGEIEKEGAEDPDLVKAYGAWLWDEEGLAEMVGQKDKPLPPAEKKAALAKLQQLTPFDREALDRFFGSLGVLDRFLRTVGPEGVAQLGQGAPPAKSEDDPGDEQKDDEKKAGEPAEAQDAAKPDDAPRQRESKNRFQGGTLFAKLFQVPLEKKKVDDPSPILTQLEALDERAFDELARTAGEQQAWEPLLQALGPRFSEVVAQKRHAPLRRALLQFPDGVCEPGERTLILQQLARLQPFEARFLRDLIVQQGSGNALAHLLGPELQLWLSGGALLAEKREPDEEPEAALAAVRELSPPVQRRLVELLTAGAVGPSLLEALGSESELFLQSYWEASTRPDPAERQSSKLPLKALAKVNPAQLNLLAWCGERKGQEPASLDAGQGATQFDVLFRPLLSGAAPSPEAKKKTLEALKSLSLMELRELLKQLSSDGTSALEALLGDGFSRVVGERLYQPFKEALLAHTGDDELPEAEKQKWLERLKELDPYGQARLKAQVAQEGSGLRLAAAFGASLKQVGLDELSDKNARPPQKPRWTPTPQQRKKLLAALKRASAANFDALLQGMNPGALQRFAAAAAAGFDEELGRALLKHLPAEPNDADTANDEAELRAFLERVISDERARADDPAPNAPSSGREAQPKKRKKDEEESPLVDDHDVVALYDKLLKDDKQAALDEFLGLPPLVQQALGQHVRTRGAYERWVARLGLDFARATAEDAAPAKPREPREEEP